MAPPRSTTWNAAGASFLRGWSLTLSATIAVATLCSFAWTLVGGGLAGWSSVVRTSAKTSLLLFLAAFAASSARALWRTQATAWLLANRRYLGVSFAASHAIHLIGIAAVAVLSPDFERGPAALIGGGLGYLLLFAMAATSSDGAVAWLGRDRWRLLHKTGMYYLGVLFLVSYIPRALAASAWYWLLAAPLLATFALRLFVWNRQRR